MEANNILHANILDIIFDHRNKAYGAYDLRKNYERRLAKAVLMMVLVVVLLLLAHMLLGAIRPNAGKTIMVKDFDLIKVEEKKKIDPPPVVMPPKQIDPVVRTLKNMVPIIVKEDIKPDEMPEQKDLDDARTGKENIAGMDDPGTPVPPVDDNKGLVDAPKKTDDTETIFTKVEIESEYPGGASAWGRFLNKNLVIPQEAIDNGEQGTVLVQFVVDTEGRVSDVAAISGPEGLRSAAVAAIRKSGRWEPAVQNGKKVKSYKKQPITIKVEDN
jgi:periplasmic protein TonB